MKAKRFIRYPPAICSMPGLFRSTRSEQRRGKLAITHDLGRGEIMQISGQEQLGVNDLRVLQGLVSLAIHTNDDIEDPTERAKLMKLVYEGGALEIHESYAKLAREIGHADPNDTGMIKRSIVRISGVVLTEMSGARPLITVLRGGRGSRLHVAIHPMMTRVILDRHARHSLIDMEEVLALKGERTRLIHQRLCGWIASGKSGSASIETLCGYVWPDPVIGAALRQRRANVRKSLGDLVALGWQVEECEPRRYKITRPGKK